MNTILTRDRQPMIRNNGERWEEDKRKRRDLLSRLDWKRVKVHGIYLKNGGIKHYI